MLSSLLQSVAEPVYQTVIGGRCRAAETGAAQAGKCVQKKH
jgi:hypothetical protein